MQTRNVVMTMKNMMATKLILYITKSYEISEDSSKVLFELLIFEFNKIFIDDLINVMPTGN